MNDKPEVIVWCTTYNHEEYIRSALEGFVEQVTNFRFKVVAHDDASMDRTAEIMREYESGYPLMFENIYQTENQYSKGVSIYRMLMESIGDCKYMAFCEGDDFWMDPLKLQKQYDFMEANPEYTACTHESERLYVPTGKTSLFTRGLKSGDLSLGEIARWGDNPGYFPQMSSYFIKKEFSAPPQWMIFEHVEDFPTMLNCAVQGKVYFMEDVMSVYRSNSAGSWTSKQTPWSHCRNIMAFDNILMRLDAETNYKYTHEITPAVICRKESMKRFLESVKSALGK